MITKVNLRLEIAGHSRTRANSIRRAVTELIRSKRLNENFSKMRRVLGDDLEILHFHTLKAIHVHGTTESWLRKFRRELRAAIVIANRSGRCRVSVRAWCDDEPQAAA